MTIECIKGFVIGEEDNSFAIMQGEVFKLSDIEDDIFTGVEGANRCPGIEISFTEEQLAENFKLVLGAIN